MDDNAREANQEARRLMEEVFYKLDRVQELLNNHSYVKDLAVAWFMLKDRVNLLREVNSRLEFAEV